MNWATFTMAPPILAQIERCVTQNCGRVTSTFAAIGPRSAGSIGLTPFARMTAVPSWTILDGHTAILMAVAEVLAAVRQELPGAV